jgi:hypothetical protein
MDDVSDVRTRWCDRTSTRNLVSTFLRKTFYVGHDTRRVSNALTLVCVATNSALVAQHSPDRADDEESSVRNSTASRTGRRYSRWSPDLNCRYAALHHIARVCVRPNKVFLSHERTWLVAQENSNGGRR